VNWLQILDVVQVALRLDTVATMLLASFSIPFAVLTVMACTWRSDFYG
jgi:hypothetical protein